MDPKQTALVLICFQNDYFSPDGRLYGALEDAVLAGRALANTLGLLEALAPTPALLVTTPIAFSPDYTELGEPVGVLKTIKEVGAFQRGGWGVEPVPELARFEGRLIEVRGKQGLNAFAGTALDEVLRAHRIEHVVIAGVVTSICVDSTGRAAAERGYRVTILDDCTCGRTAFEQEFYCDKVFPAYAEVSDSRRLLERLELPADSSGQPLPGGELQVQVQQRLFEELAAAERRYRQLIEQLRNVVIKFDADGNVLFVNAAWQQLLFYPPTQTLDRPFAAFVHPDDREAAEKALAGPPPRSRELRLRRADGSWLWFDLSVTPADGGGGIGLLYEITEKKAEEDQLHATVAASRAEVEEKSRFLAVMSHEIRTPMNGVIGVTDLLLRSTLDERQRRWVETVRASGESLLTVIDDLLDFTKLEGGYLRLVERPFAPAETVREVVRLFEPRAAAKGLALTVAAGAGLPGRLVADDQRLRQVVANLVGNAVKFTAQGEVTVAVEAGRRDDGGWMVEVTVADSGPGISPERRQRIFEPFVQGDDSRSREHGGAGLGLTISAALVRLMGGAIAVEEREGGGTRFRFTFRAGEAQEELPAAADPVLLESRPLSILLAEDDPTNVEVMEGLLGELGHRAEVARNGREVLERVRAGSYDVILMDVHMPELDGIAATRQMRAERPAGELPVVIALTADVLAENRRHCLEAGMAGFIAKPVTLAGLSDGLRRCLAGG